MFVKTIEVKLQSEWTYLRKSSGVLSPGAKPLYSNMPENFT